MVLKTPVELMVLMVFKSLMALTMLMLLTVPVMLMLIVVKKQDHFDTMPVKDEGSNGCRCWAIFCWFF